MKYLIIILICVVLFYLVTQENFDVSANLNLLTNSQVRFDNPIRMPISPDIVNDVETPKQYQFDQKVSMTTLQKLKAINNILERIKEVSIQEDNSSKITTFNPALLPVKTFEPDYDKLKVLNQVLIDRLKFYSGNQYTLSIVNMDNAYGAETDDQYRIAYFIYGIVDDIKMKIIVDLLIIKSLTTNSELNIIFTELRVDNSNVYITPYNDAETSKYESITNYNKSLTL
jgi:hypothetical protein